MKIYHYDPKMFIKMVVAALMLNAVSYDWALGDVRKPIAGAAAVLPAFFTPLEPQAAYLVTPGDSDQDAPPEHKDAPTDAKNSFQWVRPLMEKRLSPETRSTPSSYDLVDAILRIEGIFDPTRIGMFGPALRMHIRAGTASMNNVFGDRWTRADLDPNVHYRVRTFASSWLRAAPSNCDAFVRNGTDDGELDFNNLTPGECARVARHRINASEPAISTPITNAPLSVPVFAAPYPGGRLPLNELRLAQEARVRAIQRRLQFKKQLRLDDTASNH